MPTNERDKDQRRGGRSLRRRRGSVRRSPVSSLSPIQRFGKQRTAAKKNVRHTHRVLSAWLRCSLLIFSMILLVTNNNNKQTKDSDTTTTRPRVVFLGDTTTTTITTSRPLDDGFQPRLPRLMDDHPAPDWGGLVIQLHGKNCTLLLDRVVPQVDSDSVAWETERAFHLATMEEAANQGSQRQYRTERGQHCHQPSWVDHSFPTCNSIHEIVFVDWKNRFLGSGHFRDAIDIKQTEAVVLKRLRFVWYLQVDADNIDRIRREAFLLEQLSSSPRFSSLFAYCGSSIVVESLRDLDGILLPFDSNRQPERGRPANVSDTVQPFNHLSIERKLEIAVAMAESLAELHGFGVALVHDDVKAKQWMLRDNDQVVLNDLNSAFFLPWNFEEARYCKRYRSDGGPRRSPEHYVGTYIDSASDVFAFGHVLYSLLTGLYPYHEIPELHAAEMERHVMEGILPVLHKDFGPLLAEQRLIELMDECYEPDPQQRLDVFQVVRHLKETNSTWTTDVEKKATMLLSK